jgi:hypothetical protein
MQSVGPSQWVCVPCFRVTSWSARNWTKVGPIGVPEQDESRPVEKGLAAARDETRLGKLSKKKSSALPVANSYENERTCGASVRTV